MDNQSISDRYMADGRSRKPSRPRGNWQLLIVNEYGQPVRISNLKRYLVILAAAVMLLLLTAFCFAALFVHERSTRLALQSSSTRIQGTVSSLMDENNTLMARLAALCDKGEPAGESQIQPNPAEKTESPAAPQDGAGAVAADKSAAVGE
jgi:hypothetical protein